MIQGNSTSAKDQEISWTDFSSQVAQGNVQDVTIVNNSEVHGHYKNDKNNQFHLTVPASNPEVLKALDTNKVRVTFRNNDGANWPMLLIQFSPLLLIGVLWFVMIRQMQTGGNKALSFGKSRARLLSMQQKKITF